MSHDIDFNNYILLITAFVIFIFISNIHLIDKYIIYQIAFFSNNNVLINF